jgi:diguanylate cyclase (GGDEF)-like protein
MAATARLGGLRRGDIGGNQRATETPQELEGEAILRHLVDFLDAFMWQADPKTLRFTFVTTSVRDIVGHPVSSWLGGPERWGEIIHADDLDRVVGCLRATASDGLDREVEFRAHTGGGETLVLRHAVRLLMPPSGDNELWGVTTDITGDKRASEALRRTQERYRALRLQTDEFRRQALEDGLTHLPNRILFTDRLSTALRSARRSKTQLAVLLMDLDRFKKINDTRGHQAGDVVLKEVALRFRICLRGQDTPARLGGDEFAAVLPDTDAAGAIRVARRIVRALQSPITVDDSDCDIGASIGIALFPAHGDGPDDLLALADVAMYRAKRAGGGYALAEPGDEMPDPAAPTPRRRKHRGLRFIIGIAASFAILAGAAVPMAQRRAVQHTPASRLTAAAVALQEASAPDVQGVVAGVERTLAQIAWHDVAGSDVASALGRLERTLTGLRSDVHDALGERVDRLIASIQKAELVARTMVATVKPAPVGTAGPGVVARSPSTTVNRPTPLPSSLPTPTMAPPKPRSQLP